MPMTPFVERFPEVGARETRSVTVTHRQDLPRENMASWSYIAMSPAVTANG